MTRVVGARECFARNAEKSLPSMIVATKSTAIPASPTSRSAAYAENAPCAAVIFWDAANARPGTETNASRSMDAETVA